MDWRNCKWPIYESDELRFEDLTAIADHVVKKIRTVYLDLYGLEVRYNIAENYAEIYFLDVYSKIIILLKINNHFFVSMNNGYETYFFANLKDFELRVKNICRDGIDRNFYKRRIEDRGGVSMSKLLTGSFSSQAVSKQYEIE